MIIFAEMLVAPAKEAGILVPDDVTNYHAHEYPHFYVYSTMQLGAAMPSPSSAWTNAKVIASISNEEIQTITIEEVLALGFEAIM